MESIKVNGYDVSILADNQGDYISLTDIAKYKNERFPREIIKNWLRNSSTIEFLGLWESLNNVNFKEVEFDLFKMDSGLNSFVLTPKLWIEKTNAIGITSKSGRYGGTYAHKDIALEFATWISPKFKLYLIKELDRLKQKENNFDWNVRRIISKTNYKIHTESIKKNIVPYVLKNVNLIYASEADILNLAVFGITASDWKKSNPNFDGNIRDYATIEQLIILSNIESYNSILIEQKLSKRERLLELNSVAIVQMKALSNNKNIKKINIS